MSMLDLIERDKVMREIDQLSHAWEYGNAVDDCYEIVKKAPAIDAIPVENIQKLYKSALEYRDRFKPYSDKWLVANDQAIGVRSVLDMCE